MGGQLDKLQKEGEQLQRDERYEVAITVFDQCIKLDTNYSPAYYGKAQALESLNKLEDAKLLFEKALELEPTNVFARYEIGSVLSKMRRSEEALLVFDECTKQLPQYSAAYIKKGLIFRNQGKLDEAVFNFQQAILIDPTLKTIYGTLASLLIKQKKYDEAIKIFNICIKLNPDYADAYLNKAVALQGLYKFKDSHKLLQKVIIMDPKNLSAKNTLAEVLIRLHKFKEAIGVLEECIRLDPKFTAAYNNKVLAQENIDLRNALSRVRTHDGAEIRQGWLKYEEVSPRLHDYQKAFYWTLMDYFGNYSKSFQKETQKDATFNVQDNIEDHHLPGYMTQRILQMEGNFAFTLPQGGSIYQELDSVIGQIYDEIKARKLEDRITVMNRIIQKNEDTEIKSFDDFVNCLALAAQELADRKYMQYKEEDNEKKSKQEKYLEPFLKKIQDQAQAQDINLFDSEGGLEALEDILLLLIHLIIENEEIIKMSAERKLYLIIADAVMHKKSMNILDQINLSAIKAKLAKLKSCATCSIM